MSEPWLTIARATLIPSLSLSAPFFYVITAVIGTTISPYMFFWQASDEVEENKGRTRRPLRDLGSDNAIGMVISQAVAWFIIVAGTGLHGGGVTTINTAADAARALEPLVRTFPHAGEIAQALFALGIVSLGMLAVPVLAGATSYALSEARGKNEGLDLAPKQGRYFYGTIAVSMAIGLILNFTGINPIRFLVFAAVFNGVAAVPLIWIVDRIAGDRSVMGEAASGWLSRTVMALTLVGMTSSVIAIAISSIAG